MENRSAFSLSRVAGYGSLVLSFGCNIDPRLTMELEQRASSLVDHGRNRRFRCRFFPEYMGTALTLQTSMGFLLTLITVRLLPTLVDSIGWQWAFVILVLGPMFGIWAMRTLKQSPAAAKLAGGHG